MLPSVKGARESIASDAKFSLLCGFALAAAAVAFWRYQRPDDIGVLCGAAGALFCGGLRWLTLREALGALPNDDLIALEVMQLAEQSEKRSDNRQ